MVPSLLTSEVCQAASILKAPLKSIKGSALRKKAISILEDSLKLPFLDEEVENL